MNDGTNGKCDTKTLFVNGSRGVRISNNPFLNEIKSKFEKIAEDSAETRAMIMHSESVLMIAQAGLHDELAAVAKLLMDKNNTDDEIYGIKDRISELESTLKNKIEETLTRSIRVVESQSAIVETLDNKVKFFDILYKRIIIILIIISVMIVMHIASGLYDKYFQLISGS